MTDPTITQPPPQPIRQPTRNRKLAVAATMVLLIVTLFTGIWLQSVSRSRYKVIGKTDPVTGYHIEYTVSSRYIESQEAMVPTRPESGRNDVFTPRPQPKAVQWVNEHIPRRPKYPKIPGSTYWKPGVIVQIYADDNRFVGVAPDAQGYPDVSFVRGAIYAKVVVKHMLVSGCRATWLAYNYPSGGKLRPRTYLLLIVATGLGRGSGGYWFEAIDNATNPTGVESELLKIRDSIRITRASSKPSTHD